MFRFTRLIQQAVGKQADKNGDVMTNRELADIICRSLLAIVAALRKRYELPAYNNITIVIKSQETESQVEPLDPEE